MKKSIGIGLLAFIAVGLAAISVFQGMEIKRLQKQQSMQKFGLKMVNSMLEEEPPDL